MRALGLALILCVLGNTAWADTPDLGGIVDHHILPGYRALAEDAAALDDAAQADCAPNNEALRAAYGQAFDAWIAVSHLRFGPSEKLDRAFALAFWPDPRSKTPKTLLALLAAQDPVVAKIQTFRDVSIAVRGFYALEFLLYDTQFVEADEVYTCALIRAIAADIALNATGILADWEGGYADLLRLLENDIYRTEEEATRQLFTALLAGLEFTSDARLGRPLGSFERPRPKRAEAWRSGRSLRHVVMSLHATRALAYDLSRGDTALDAAFTSVIADAEALEDPIFAGVSDPASRFRVEALKARIDDLRNALAEDLGLRLGIVAGFNSLDGD
ncbi:MAG: imelysin family protein [Paracoccaceae bacterium]